ncbi:hypothetical protein EZH22_11480 [Xanthobacter dioxanivorans]|uniref:Uncharacterized protein n=1 Tax=Xanthobacter dioxanivorans TaxID=2528964 RepID=A0A974PTJ2_9HYPH|nr:hypothetical protein [Xanthobacter dioxanivorans]QRG08840.1 hypothetical protein EZH22_11480 [Xanthobacter dioxanivorans]
MAAAPSGAKTSSILRLRAGLLLLVTSIVLCGAGGHFVARQFGLGLGWAILLAVVIWVAVGMLLARLDTRIYYAAAVMVTALLGYLVYDFSASAIGWSSGVSLVLAAVAIIVLGFTFYDFRQLKRELRLWAYRK